MKMIKLIGMCVIVLSSAVACAELGTSTGKWTGQTITVDLDVRDEGFYHKLLFRNQCPVYDFTKFDQCPVFYGQVDTGSCNTVIPSRVCFNCTTSTKMTLLYDHYNDSGYYTGHITSCLKPKTYLSAQFQTIQVRDRIMFQTQAYTRGIGTTVELVVSSPTNYTFDSIIGLCPQDCQNGMNDLNTIIKGGKKTTKDQRPLQRNTLAYDIKFTADYWKTPTPYKNVFSIHLDPADIYNKSTMIYGGIHDQFQQKPIVYFQNHETKPGLWDYAAKIWHFDSKKRAYGTYKSDKWKVELTETRLGGKRIGGDQSPLLEFALFDTGCTFHKAINATINEIIRQTGLEEVYRGETQITKCSAKQFEELGPLHFHSQGKVITLAKLQWVKFRVQGQQSYCAIMISPLPPGKWDGHFILGFNFFKQHYTVFDNEKNRIGVYDLRNERSEE